MKRNHGSLPQCRNALTNFIFQEFIHLLVHHVKKVYLVKDLRDPDNLKMKLYGLWANRTIYLNAEMCEHEKIKTFIHELAHAHFAFTSEKSILKIEEILWRAFSLDQKALLGKFIASVKPCKQPKKKPRR